MTPDSVRGMTLATAAAVLVLASLYAYESTPAVVLAIALAIFIAIASWQPLVAIGLVAATLPLYHQPIETGTLTLAPSELLLGAALAGTVVSLALMAARPDTLSSSRDIIREISERLTSGFSLVSLAGLAILAIVGLALLGQVDDTDSRSAGLREWRWTLIEPMIFVGLLEWHVTSRRRRYFVLGAFVAGGLVVGVWGLIDAATGGGVEVGGVIRAGGPFPHPNAYGLYLLRPVVFGAAYLVLTRAQSPLLWVLCGIGAVALAASFSRSAALGLLVAGLLLLPWLAMRVRMIAALAAAALAVALIIVAGDRAIGASGTDSLALRGDIWQSGLAMIRDRPVTGYGPDQFLYVYAPRYIDPAAWTERFTSHGHNLIIDAWVRVGIIGAVFVVLALILITKAAQTAVQPGVARKLDAVAVAAIIALAAAATQAMVDNGYFVHDLAMSAWLLAWAGFAGSTVRTQRGAILHERGRDRRSGTRRLASL